MPVSRSAGPRSAEHGDHARRFRVALVLAGVAASLGFYAVGSPAGLAASNGVVHGQNLTGDPVHGGSLIASEWLALGLGPGAETVRRQTSDGIITTRTDVPCIKGVPNLGLCPELRQATGPTFSRDRGAYLGDANIQQPSDLEDAVLLGRSGVRPAATGPLGDVLPSWQAAPPGHSSEYVRYDAPGGNGSEWFDAATRLPLKLMVRSGRARQSTYWTYDPRPIEPATLPADFFLLALPAHPAQYAQQLYYPGGRLPGSVTDSATGARFTPLSLGPAPRIGGQGLCLDSASLYRFFESGDRITRIDVEYVLRKRGAGCVPGRHKASNGGVQILTFAKRSPDAAANRRPFQGTRPVPFKRGGRLLPVYVTPAVEGATAALVDIGASTVLINSRLRLTHRRDARTTQILALVSHLRG